MTFRFRVKYIFMVLFVLAAAGCQTQKSRKPSPDWSRGVPLGFSVQGSVGMAVGETGQGPLLVWPEMVAGGLDIRYVAVDETAVPHINHFVGVNPASDELRTPRLALADDGAAHLFWSSRPAGERMWTLFYVLLDQAGDPRQLVQQISLPGTAVSSYVVTPDGKGGVFIAWEDANTDGLYAQHLTATGAALSEPVMIAADAQLPALQIDTAGTLHLLWYDGRQILYAGLPDGLLTTAVGRPIADLQLGSGDALAGPVLGLTEDAAYAIWSVLSSSGLEAGTGRTEYAAFAPDAPQMSTPERLFLPTDEDLPYEAYQSSYQVTQLAPPGGVRGASEYVYHPETAVGMGPDLAVAVETSQAYRLQTYTQIAVLLFAEGRLQGQAMASRTDSFSRDPILEADEAGNLHLVWREGGRGQTLYYATTAPQAKEVLDNLNREDLFGILLNGGMESVAGVLFFPVAFIWLLPGLMLLGLWKLHISDDDFSHPITILLFVTAVAGYETIKVLFLPTITAYVPFSAWVDVAPAWQQPLLIGVPILIFAVAALAAGYVYKRSSSPSALLTYFVLAAVDAVLSLAVYGVNFLGVF